jgi:hypothetical protein
MLGGGEVGAEWFFHNHARPAGILGVIQTGGFQLGEDVVEKLRRAGDVEQAVALAAATVVDRVESFCQRGVAICVVELGLVVANAMDETIPDFRVVAAAGNSYYKTDTPTGQDYNNSIKVLSAPGYSAEPSILRSTDGLEDLYYHRGNSPAACPGVICVGAAGVGSPEYKADFSNTGPRVDVYAPGEYINSSVYPSINFEPHGIPDPRNSNYHLTKWSGTSMASPQVAGMLACYAQTNRSINQASAMNFINSNSKSTLGNGSGDKSLQGGSNKYAYMPNITHTTP